MKALLIKEDKHQAEREIKILESKTESLNGLVSLFMELDLGDLDNKTAISLLLDKGVTAGDYFLNSIEADYLSTGVKNKNLIELRRKEAQTIVDVFVYKVKEILKPIESICNLSFYSYDEGKGYYVSKESKELISENHKIYLKDDKEIMIFQEFQKCFNSMENLKSKIDDFVGSSYSGSCSGFFEGTDGVKRSYRFDTNGILNLIYSQRNKK
jgi:hypothetical protein